MIHLLDTNICIAILNDSSSPAARELAKLSPVDVKLCAIVKSELFYGAFRSQRAQQNLALLDRFFSTFDDLPFDEEAALILGRERARLSRLGTPIGPYDAVIAATALRYQATLVTNNVAEFDRVERLRWIDWITGLTGGPSP